jgi:hypothetical protein
MIVVMHQIVVLLAKQFGALFPLLRIEARECSSNCPDQGTKPQAPTKKQKAPCPRMSRGDHLVLSKTILNRREQLLLDSTIA